ncbi:hypothetical protein KJ633_05915 [bacterium]|nr:hypothetical protein [bacterium]MBU3955980.1 hypothetical protein [bacterium]MBU4134264.1 hypothetical protein [bacterium]
MITEIPCLAKGETPLVEKGELTPKKERERKGAKISAKVNRSRGKSAGACIKNIPAAVVMSVIFEGL